MMSHNSYLLSLQNVRKTFGPVQALRGVSLQVLPGEVHALIGENGAGKSTLMKVLSGAHQPDKGSEIFLNGKPYQPASPAEGREAGIAMIYQELTLALHLTVEENVTLGLEKAKFGFVQSQRTKVKEALEWLGQEQISPQAKISTLSIGKQQLVEIARALMSDAQIVIMDEPTSSLSAADAQSLFKVIRRLRDKGIAVIYISHFLEEVQEISDRFTVLRDGATIASGTMADTSLSQIIEYMVGRPQEELYPHVPHTIGETILEVSNLTGEVLPKRTSFQLRRGEILGVAGLIGAGRSETIRSLFGLDKVENGNVSIKGQPQVSAAYLSPQKALSLGMDLLSENRKEEGLALNLPIFTNLTLSALGKYSRGGFLNLKEELVVAKEWISKLSVKTGDANRAIGTLSGGNQQKVCIARLLHHDSQILFLDEPTRGIDVGSKAEIYRMIHSLAAQGKAIVMISSYIPELVGVCDSLAVMHRGEMSPVKPVSAWTEHEIMLYATSGTKGEAAG
jgi:ribose transport system ATP-binding protein